MTQPIRVGIIGMGGFAASHQREVMACEAAGECRLICTCDPAPENFAAQMAEWEFEKRGVRVYRDYLKMLDECATELDMVAIPTPVPLHAPMHRACVERDLAVYLEKPPTLDWRELEAMLEVEQRARRLTNVGFNFIVGETRRAIKRRIIAGDFGRVKRVEYCGLARRATDYYQRARWAGRLVLQGQIVLDSPLGNALAHQVHDLLFWAGQASEMSWAEIAWVEAELYRARPDIQGADVIFVVAGLDSDIQLRIVAAHACAESISRERVICERAIIEWTPHDGYRIIWEDGCQESMPPEEKLFSANYAAYFAYLRGELDRPITRLIDARPFVYLNNLAYIAAGRIQPVPSAYVCMEILPKLNSPVACLAELAYASEKFLDHNAWPSQAGMPWAADGHARAVPSDLSKFFGTIQAMAAASPVGL